MKARFTFISSIVGTLAVALGADAHVAISSGPAAIGSNQEVVFSVGHGCDGADTYSVKVDIPAGVTSVRPMTSDFGKAKVAKDPSGNVTSITWQKQDVDALDADDNFYKLVIRLKTPAAPFTQLYFPTHQTCRAADGTLSTADWVAQPGETGEPAPSLLVVPARFAGWNKYTLTAPIADLSVFFKDAQIVWRGNEAYSSNPNTAAQIASTPGVTALSGALATNDVLWVKY